MNEALPQGWSSALIGDICRLINGRAFKPSDWATIGLPIVRIQNLNDPKARFNHYNLPVDDRYYIENGELLFAWSGTPGTSFGAHIWGGQRAILNQHIFRILFDEQSLSKKFLRLAINDRLVHLVQIAHGGVGLRHVTKPVFESTAISIPPLDEQRRIVAKIDALTAKSRRAKEALDAIPLLLDKLRQSILAAAFRGDLTADWRAAHPDVEPASQLLDRIRAERRRCWEEAELAKMKAKGKAPADDRWKAKYQEPEPVDESGWPELPEGWCWGKASDIVAPGADIVYGIVQPGPPRSEGVPYVRGKDIQDDEIVVDQLWRTSEKIAAEYPRSKIRTGDVLLCVIRHLKVAVVPSELDGGNLSRTTSLLRPATGIQTDFLANALRSPWCQSWLKSRYRGGTSMPKVNIADACELPVPIAPQSEQSQVCQAIQNSFRSLKNVQEAFARSSQDLASMDPAILAKAFRGELVPQDPNDEPASVLLERIRTESGVQPKQTSRRRKARTA